MKIFSKKYFSMVLILILVLSLSMGTYAAATMKYSSIIGGGNEIYFASQDGKLFVSKYKSNDLFQLKDITNVKMAADDCYFGLWVLDKAGSVFFYQEDYEIANKYGAKKKIDIDKVKTIGIGSEGIYALKDDGTVWGVNRNKKVFQVKGLSNIISISVRDFDVIALKKDGTAWQWRDDAQVADYIKKMAVTQVTGLKNVKEVSAGANCGLALLKDNSVWQWSFDSLATKKPVKITGFTGTKSIEAGRMDGYAIDGKGDVWTWSFSTNKSQKPAKVKGVASIIKIAASGKDSTDGFSSGRLVTVDKNNKVKFINGEYY